MYHSHTPHTTTTLNSQPTLITYNNRKYLIMDAPSDSTLPLYLSHLKANNISTIVRLCQPTYKAVPPSITIVDLPFEDGEAPSASIIDKWLEIVATTDVAVHCVAGLGRAPVLVAIALIEDGMNNLDSVSYIRERRKGAINNKQLRFVESYKRRRGRARGKGCSLS